MPKKGQPPNPYAHGRICPDPVTTYFVLVISGSAIGPRACSFWVEIPISAPNPNSPPSVKRLLALTRTTAASTSATNRSAAVRSVSYTHLRAHETVLDLVCRLL